MTLPPTTWSVTGKRGRRRRAAHYDQVKPRDEDRDVALFLLSLASSAAATSDLRLEGISPAPAAEVGERQRLRWRKKAKRKREEEEEEVAETTKWRPRVYECEVCAGRFRTAQALGGHTRNHLEKDVRGKLVKRKMRKISSLAFDSGLSFRFEPSAAASRSSSSPFASSSLEEQEAQEEEDHAGGQQPSALRRLFSVTTTDI